MATNSYIPVVVLATVTASGNKPEHEVTLEAMMPVGAILNAPTLSAAMKLFIDHCDYQETILEVHSFTVGGREMIRTFLH